MRELLVKHRDKLVALLLVLLPALLLASRAGAEVGSGSSTRLGGWGRGVSGWGQLAVFDALRGLAGIASWRGDEALLQENARLKTENALLREEKARLIGVLQENARLRELVGFQRAHPEYELVAARVVARDVTPYFRALTVRVRPAQQRIAITRHMPVVVAGGIIGQVHQIHGDQVEIILLADPRSRVDVISQRNRAHGIAQGLGHERDYHVNVSYLSEKDHVQVGDVMVTSGMGGLFPPELIVGEVRSVAPDERGLFQRVVLAPAADLSRLDEVFIIAGTRVVEAEEPGEATP